MANQSEDLTQRWGEYIQADWIQALDETPFLSRCRQGNASKEELNTFLVQQYYYAKNFTRYLCALLSNIDNDMDRRELTENLVDESGLGTHTGTPHSILYRHILERMGVDPKELSITQATIDLVDTMLESCKSPNAAVGLGALCLGAEAIVPHLYSQIVQGFEAKGYTKKDLDFFYLHIACDDEHALTMKKIIDREMHEPKKRSALEASAKRVIAARARFFQALAPKEDIQNVAV
jgi:pyrroloquinoline-quinone synthase